jgi:hypothetical protein
MLPYFVPFIVDETKVAGPLPALVPYFVSCINEERKVDLLPILPYYIRIYHLSYRDMKVCGPASNIAYLVSFITEERKVTGPTINIFPTLYSLSWNK